MCGHSSFEVREAAAAGLPDVAAALAAVLAQAAGSSRDGSRGAAAGGREVAQATDDGAITAAAAPASLTAGLTAGLHSDTAAAAATAEAGMAELGAALGRFAGDSVWSVRRAAAGAIPRWAARCALARGGSSAEGSFAAVAAGTSARQADSHGNATDAASSAATAASIAPLHGGEAQGDGATASATASRAAGQPGPPLSEAQREQVVTLTLDLIHDTSQWVRWAAMEAIGPLIAALPPHQAPASLVRFRCVQARLIAIYIWLLV